MRRSLLTTGTAAATVLLLTGCSGGGGLRSVELTGDPADGEIPQVDFQTPIQVEENETKVLEEGDGDDIDSGDTLMVQVALFRGSDKEQLGESYTQGPGQVLRFDDALKERLPELYEALDEMKVGGILAYSSPTTAGSSGEEDDQSTAVEVYQIVDEVPSEIEGDMKDSPEGLPAVTENDEDVPQIAEPTGEAPSEVVSDYLIEGDGEEVQEGDTVIADYVGARWEDGEVFDSSYDRGAPTVFPLDGVIEGWSEGLVGERVGSRVIISVPADKAYGTQEEIEASGGGDAPAGALVFVVDILDTAETPESAQPAPQDTASPAAGSPAPSSPAAATASAAPSADSAEG